ncbi:MAG: cupin domain-containing protein [SAR324 cluster bacterium]|nr:cupin domain-containing protein [SAR324 cluster bacterium]
MDLVVKGKFPAPVDQGAVGREWAGRGYDCRLFVDPPGREWNGFVHATNELVTVVEGALLCTVEIDTVEINAVEKKTIRLEMGDELFIPRDAVHSVKNIHTGTTRWLFGYD